MSNKLVLTTPDQQRDNLNLVKNLVKELREEIGRNNERNKTIKDFDFINGFNSFLANIAETKDRSFFEKKAGDIYEKVNPVYNFIAKWLAAFLMSDWFYLVICIVLLVIIWKLFGKPVFRWICDLICRFLRAARG